MNDMISSIATMTAAANPPAAGDYVGDDGLLYCGICHTPKQHIISNRTVGKMIVPCMCDCRRARKSAEDAAEVERQRAERVVRNRQAGIPPQFRNWTFANDDGRNAALTARVKDYADKFNPRSGAGLLLYGEPGRGKSYAAAEIANALIDRGYRVYMTNFARLSNVLSSMREGRQDWIDGLRSYDLLVIDDLGAERDTSTMYETVHNVIESIKGISLIVTTNMTAHDMLHPRGITEQRVVDRILEACDTYEAVGVNRRMQKLIDRKGGDRP